MMSSSPASIRSAVVLPHPEGPTRTRNSPSATSMLRVVDSDDLVEMLGDVLEGDRRHQDAVLRNRLEQEVRRDEKGVGDGEREEGHDGRGDSDERSRVGAQARA